jgi:tRNA(Ile)-lysidine synthase
MAEKNSLEKHVTAFLQLHIPTHLPIVVGVSGGGDSMALLMALFAACRIQGRKLHAVHVDHGWRPESGNEACLLQKQLELLEIPCHVFRISSVRETGENLEDWSRRQRMMFFKQVVKEVGATGVFLAHQADDQIEITVKRFLEGASVTKLRGMRSIEQVDGLVVMRPLLSFRREFLREWLHKQSISYFEDPTNQDVAFLRARMRHSLFPFLRRSFGKEFDHSVLRVSQESALLEQFLEEECRQRFESYSFEGVAFGFPKEGCSSTPYFLAKSLLDEVLKNAGISCSRQQVLSATQQFCENKLTAKTWNVAQGGVFVERHLYVAFREKPSPFPRIECSSSEGEVQTPFWQIQWRPTTTPSPNHSGKWMDLFLGKQVSIPCAAGPFILCRANESLLRDMPRSQRKLPSALRPFVPVILQGERLVADPCNGYTAYPKMCTSYTEVIIRRR